MNNLQHRHKRVARLQRLALQDRNPKKYIQAAFILSQIEQRMFEQRNSRIKFITKLKQD